MQTVSIPIDHLSIFVGLLTLTDKTDRLRESSGGRPVTCGQCYCNATRVQ